MKTAKKIIADNLAGMETPVLVEPGITPTMTVFDAASVEEMINEAVASALKAAAHYAHFRTSYPRSNNLHLGSLPEEIRALPKAPARYDKQRCSCCHKGPIDGV